MEMEIWISVEVLIQIKYFKCSWEVQDVVVEWASLIWEEWEVMISPNSSKEEAMVPKLILDLVDIIDC